MNHKDLDVWKESIELVSLIYKITKDFPKTEVYGLTGQIRRSAVSIPSNIAEGSGRNNWKELHYFVGIANGSASELETQLIIADNLEFLSEEYSKLLLTKVERVRKMISGYKRYVKNKMC
ncbi:four helix bundle protein [Psychroflexus sp. CAK57W]|uniref:four helix bundle protein n=1 Tax=Psychroflexus curvus TaxID=2873595 RepID=UPI001CC93681|nr:four helix bundle protein [Psychroflexus curvus]MBZ9787860.1 four helix bundle protein [Psychroflexus curvus]